MIEVNNITKIYKLSKKQMQQQKTKKNRKVAVRDVSFTAREGEIFGLLGPNGAGKTTTLRCIATLLKPTQGTILVQGQDTVKEGKKVRQSIAFLTSELKLDPQFSPKYLFHFFGQLHGMSEEEIARRQEELFPYFGITEFQDKKVEELSTGMKQKTSIAVSLVHNPEVVIFDEPTNGLDIVTARAVTDYLRVLKEQGKVVVVSTHIMSEAQKLCDRLAMIINGSAVFEGTLEEVLEKTETDDLEEAFFSIYREHVTDEQERRELEDLDAQMRQHETEAAKGKGGTL
ncbi:MAG: ABC transporter ATP-binding protein [Lachnospiraceae bacterium]|nr:ABC transporter ATP-binding protein [Lachnospiraceae bacterium]